MNNLDAYKNAFDSITPWSGRIPAGYTVDFLGNLTSKDFLTPSSIHPAFFEGNELTIEIPHLRNGDNGEFFFEAGDWALAAREARDQFVMITLGALYGYQAIGSHRMLQLLNPMPYKLVAVDPVPENLAWVRRNMRDNGIDPDKQWIVQAAMSDSNEPAFFPVGAPGAGANNCLSTNVEAARQDLVRDLVASGQAEAALTNLLLHNTTGLTREVARDSNAFAEIKLVSALTLEDVLGPFERVDLLESDIQQSEIVVFPPFMDLLRRKVKRIHLGTHGGEVHTSLQNLFTEKGWDVVVSFPAGFGSRDRTRPVSDE